MSQNFGEYEATGVVDVELGDDFWEVQPNQPAIPEGDMIFYIEGYEPHWGTSKPSFGYNFLLRPYQDIYSMPVDPHAQEGKPLKKYMFVGNGDKITQKLYAGSQSPYFQQFLASIGFSKDSDKNIKFSVANVRGILVKGKVEWTKLVSTRENPNTGQVPTAIDENDPYSYVQFARIADGTEIRGVRDDAGNVKRVNI